MATRKKVVVVEASTRDKLLDIGAKMVAQYGAINVTRRAVAKAAGVSDALVAHYFGNSTESQKAFKRQARKLGLSEPSKADIEAAGVKLRMKGPRKTKTTRKRSVKEVKAIRNKLAASPQKVVAKKSARVAAATTSTSKPQASVATATTPSALPRSKAARAPKAPPPSPPAP